jgi:hypothetical protein
VSEAAALERGFRRLLACYPRAYRRENEEEICTGPRYPWGKIWPLLRHYD